MADLKFDIDAFRVAEQSYINTAGNMDELKRKLEGQIEGLKNTYWKSAGGEAFMELYENEWAANVDKYVAVLNEMSVLLGTVRNAYYEPLEERAKSLRMKSLDEV